MRVEIHIKRISMQGVPVGSRAQLLAALESELARLVTEGGTPGMTARDAHRKQLRSRPIALSTGPSADARTGHGLARRIYESLGADGRSARGAAPGGEAPTKRS
jgi:hypothetical protein